MKSRVSSLKKLNMWCILTAILLGLGVTPASQANAQGESDWLVMLYQVADDNTLEEDIMIDFNEAEMVGSSDKVQVVAQVDRFQGSYEGMGDWTSTKRFYLTADKDLKEIASEELEDLGEINMAEGDVLVDFISWAVTNYPAKKYALVMSDHGMGWQGGFSDPDPGEPGADNIALLDLFGNQDALWLMEIDRSLEKARDMTGIDQFDLITLDVCLMGQLEVFNAMAPHSKYVVASEEVVPGVGMAYADFLSKLVKTPSMDGKKLAEITVDGFLIQDKRLLDPDFSGGAPADELGASLLYDSTAAAIDTAEVPAINAALDEFIATLAEVDSNTIAEARTYAQSYAAPFGDEYPSSYIDLGHFSQLVSELSGNETVATAAQALQLAMYQGIVKEKHGEGRPGSTGIAIYFPTPDLFAQSDNWGYTTVAARFAEATQWDEFLAVQSGAPQDSFAQPRPKDEDALLPEEVNPDELEEAISTMAYYIDQEGQALADIPTLLAADNFSTEVIQYMTDQGMFKSGRSSRAAVIGPKPLQVAPLLISSNVVSSTSPLTVTTAIEGERLAHVYQFVGRYLPRENILIYEDKDYITSGADKTIGGVTYPDWGDGAEVPLQVEWQPTVYAVSDGTTSIRALFEPESYGTTPTYALQGTYAFTDGSPAKFAKMLFRDANEDGVIEMTQILGYSGQVLTDSVGAPRQITPEMGDSFTVLQIGEDGATGEPYRAWGETITLTNKPLFIEETPAPSGNYVFGVMAEDLDGNIYDEYQDIFVYNPDAAAVDGFVPYINQEIGFALLHPETWTAEADSDGVFFASDTVSPTFVLVTSGSYTPTATPAEMNFQAIQEATEALSQLEAFENLEFTTEITDTYIGIFEGQSQEFSYDLDGEAYYGEVIATTPTLSQTYVVLITAPDATYDEVLTTSFNPLIASFDMFVMEHEQPQVSVAAPTMAKTTFKDDFSKATSGLTEYDTMQEWGRGYYAKTGQYVYALNFAPGYFVYDYYADQTLADDFMIQVTSSYTGSANNGYGLIFQVTRPATATEETPDQFYTFRISGDGFYIVEKMGETPENIIEWTPSDLIQQEEGLTNTLAVVGRQGSYDLFINGQQVDSFSDSDYQAGTFGIMAENFDTEQLANFSYDDLQVGTVK